MPDWDTTRERMDQDVWALVGRLENALPPEDVHLVHKLRLAVEALGAARAVANYPLRP
jgi:hypothetical protein